jgi:hypothetical protein
MRRQLLDPPGSLSAAKVVARLGGVQAQVATSANLAVRVRRETSRPGDVDQALARGTLIKVWAMRGALHLLTPDQAGAVLSLTAAHRTWLRPSWQRYFGMRAEDWEFMRPVVREALADGPLSREDLSAAICREPRLAHLSDELRGSWGMLFKPLAWQGELCHGPSDGSRITFARPDLVCRTWPGLRDADEAAPEVVATYLGANGPATPDGFVAWLGGGWFGKRRPRAWFAALGDRLAEVDVDGEPRWVLAEHAAELAATRRTRAVRLVPGFDQWVLGPGTSDTHVVAGERRAAVSRQAGWISPVVVAGGVVAGTWAVQGADLTVAWFGERGRAPRRALHAEVARIGSLVGTDLRLGVTAA